MGIYAYRHKQKKHPREKVSDISFKLHFDLAQACKGHPRCIGSHRKVVDRFCNIMSRSHAPQPVANSGVLPIPVSARVTDPPPNALQLFIRAPARPAVCPEPRRFSSKDANMCASPPALRSLEPVKYWWTCDLAAVNDDGRNLWSIASGRMSTPRSS